jgi:integrase
MHNVSHTIQRKGIYYFSLRIPSTNKIHRQSLFSDSSRKCQLLVLKIIKQIKIAKIEGVVLDSDKLKGIISCILSNQVRKIAEHTKAVLDPLSDEAAKLNKSYQSQTGTDRNYNYHVDRYGSTHYKDLPTFTEYLVSDFDKGVNDLSYFKEWNEDEEEYVVPEENNHIQHEPLYIAHESVMDSLQLQSTKLKQLLLDGDNLNAEKLIGYILKTYSEKETVTSEDPVVTSPIIKQPELKVVTIPEEPNITVSKFIDELMVSIECNNKEVADRIERGLALKTKAIDMREHKKHFNIFKHILGEESITDVDHRVLNSAMDIVHQLPKANKGRANDDNPYSLLSLDERIERARDGNVPKEYLFKSGSAKHARAALSLIFKSAFDQGVIKDNPYHNMNKTIKGETSKRVSFDNVTALRLASHCKEHLQYADENYIGLIMLYSGMRNQEAIQLRRCDIKIDPVTKCHYFRVDPAAGQVKNDPSNRKIPIHNVLLEAGLLEFIADKNGTERIFDTSGVKVNKWYNKVKKELGIPTVNGEGNWLTLYSARHSFRTTLSNVGTLEEHSNALLGHAGKNTGEKNYLDLQMMPLNMAIEYFSYDNDAQQARLRKMYE